MDTYGVGAWRGWEGLAREEFSGGNGTPWWELIVRTHVHR